jgi:hypothetical protein
MARGVQCSKSIENIAVLDFNPVGVVGWLWVAGWLFLALVFGFGWFGFGWLWFSKPEPWSPATTGRDRRLLTLRSPLVGLVGGSPECGQAPENESGRPATIVSGLFLLRTGFRPISASIR